MVFLALIVVLRGFYGCGVQKYASPVNPCAALISTKNPHFWFGHSVVFAYSFKETEQVKIYPLPAVAG